MKKWRARDRTSLPTTRVRTHLVSLLLCYLDKKIITRRKTFKFPLIHELRAANLGSHVQQKVAHIATWVPPTHMRAVTTTAAGAETKKTASLLG